MFRSFLSAPAGHFSKGAFRFLGFFRLKRCPGGVNFEKEWLTLKKKRFEEVDASWTHGTQRGVNFFALIWLGDKALYKQMQRVG